MSVWEELAGDIAYSTRWSPDEKSNLILALTLHVAVVLDEDAQGVQCYLEMVSMEGLAQEDPPSAGPEAPV
jgi:hypothetical protein